VGSCGATTARQAQFDLWPFFVKQQRLVGSYGRSRADFVQTLDWAAKGQLKPVIDKVFRLGETAQAFERLRKREALGKLLIMP